MRWRTGGVYLITGGLGTVGLALAEYLAEKCRAKIVLIGRTGLPERSEWNDWLKTHDAGDTTSRRIRQIKKVEKLGGEVLIIRADVADEQQMTFAWERAERQFGCIHGVIHTARYGTPISIQELKRSDCEGEFHSKAYGTYVLEKFLRNKPVDFCHFTSSLASPLGGLGFGAYSAANSFLDAFALKQNQTSPFPWISVNWDGWNYRTEKTEETSVMTLKEGVEVFDRIMSAGIGGVVAVSPTDMQTRIDRWIHLETSSAGELEPRNLHSRPNISSVYIAPRNETEQTIVEIWGQFLGIEKLGIYDNFFELGGNSLLATRMVSRVRKNLKVEIPLKSLFEAPTVGGFAVIVARCCEEAERSAQLELLKRIESQTEEETKAELEELSGRG
jgi:NAD(P)-dependent dehydrogenase (short-subunit alcohol dehydrogenase family)/acyl carrier protein